MSPLQRVAAPPEPGPWARYPRHRILAERYEMAGYESMIDRQIRKAREEGAFDDLPGTGKPDPNLHEVEDPHWWAKKFVQREGLQGGGVLPPALELRRERERTLAEVGEAGSEEEVRDRLLALNDRIRRMNSRGQTSGPSSNMSPVEVEEVLAAWRDREEKARKRKDEGTR